MSPAEPSRRERARDALREAALRRFVADGFDATNVADVAADVGVTTRTFYRYFASKDEVLFADYEARLDWFRRALSVRPRREAITQSVLAAVDSFPDDPQVVSEIARLRSGELDHRRIEPHIRRVQSELAREIEAHLLARRTARTTDNDRRTRTARTTDTDRSTRSARTTDADAAFDAAVTAQAIAAAVFTAIDRWMATDGTDLDELSRLTARALATLDAGLAAP